MCIRDRGREVPSAPDKWMNHAAGLSLDCPGKYKLKNNVFGKNVVNIKTNMNPTIEQFLFTGNSANLDADSTNYIPGFQNVTDKDCPAEVLSLQVSQPINGDLGGAPGSNTLGNESIALDCFVAFVGFIIGITILHQNTRVRVSKANNNQKCAFFLIAHRAE
eukprot:TRINITY_DN5873_c0_g1_i1.p1 TRINITY_DN5873_c0_g1~~TRINITY_DN5873_c0_g1_i1.p1  ORF type:complete len:189 (-),score=47.12 TRINITY_DN5873_c0_g1_i1:239-724(-)